MGINLLPPKYQSQPLIEQKKIIKIIFSIILIAVLIFISTAYYFYRTSLEKELSNLEENINKLHPTFTKIKETNAFRETTVKLDDLAQEIGKDKQLWSEILADLTRNLASGISLSEIIKDQDKLIIRGRATDFKLVGDFAQKIKGWPWFEVVDINYSTKIKELNNSSNYHELNLLPSLKNKENIILTEQVEFLITAQLKEELKLVMPQEGGEPN